MPSSLLPHGLLQPFPFGRGDGPDGTRRSLRTDLQLDHSSGRFDDYLEVARSAGALSRSRKADAPSPPEKSDKPESQDEAERLSEDQSEPTADAAGDAGAEGAVVGVEVIEPVIQQPLAAAGAEEGRASDAPLQAEVAPISGEGEADGRERPLSDAIRRLGSDERTLSEPVPQKGSVTGDPNGPVDSQPTAVSVEGDRETTEQAVQSRPARSDRPAVRGESGSAVGRGAQKPAQTINASVDEAPKAVSVKERPTEFAGPLAQQETVHQRKVRQSIQQREEGETSGRRSGQTPNGPVGMKRGVAPSATGAPQATTGYLDTLEKLETVSVRGGRSDNAAASVARFLIDGLGEPANATATNGATAQQTGFRPLATSAAALTPTTAGVNSTTAAAAEPADGNGSLPGVQSPAEVAEAVRVLRASGASGRFGVTLQLEPPELGQLKVEIQMQHQAMSLRVAAQTKAVGSLIESRLSELRDALAAHGIRIERAEIMVRANESSHADNQQRTGDNAFAEQGRPGAEGDQNQNQNQNPWGPADRGSEQAGEGRHAHQHGLSDGRSEDAEGDTGMTQAAEEAIEVLAAATELSVDVMA